MRADKRSINQMLGRDRRTGNNTAEPPPKCFLASQWVRAQPSTAVRVQQHCIQPLASALTTGYATKIVFFLRFTLVDFFQYMVGVLNEDLRGLTNGCCMYCCMYEFEYYARYLVLQETAAVSYTHLTLPTICSV